MFAETLVADSADGGPLSERTDNAARPLGSTPTRISTSALDESVSVTAHASPLIGSFTQQEIDIGPTVGRLPMGPSR
ncbi:MAG: hypothetical protein AAFV43_10185 [Planctomycetota bacterium]